MSNNPLLDTAISDRLSALGDRFIQHERFENLASEFHSSLKARLADLRSDRVKPVQNISLIADAGSGKSTAIRKLVEQTKGFLLETDFPEGKIVQLELEAAPTYKSVGLDLLQAMEPNLKPNRENWYIWNLVRFHLRKHNVLFIHLDEAQHLKMRGHKRDIPEIVDALKSISSDREWPAGFILSGTRDLETILNFDPQLVRRTSGVEFAPLTRRGDAEDVLALIESYASEVGLSFDYGDPDQELGERVIHASAYQFGLVIKLTLKAIEKSLDADAKTLELKHFADAYQAEKSCDYGFNPFLITQYTQIDPRQMFAKEDQIQ